MVSCVLDDVKAPREEATNSLTPYSSTTGDLWDNCWGNLVTNKSYMPPIPVILFIIQTVSIYSYLPLPVFLLIYMFCILTQHHIDSPNMLLNSPHFLDWNETNKFSVRHIFNAYHPLLSVPNENLNSLILLYPLPTY